MDEAAILERIRSFPRWHYQLDLQGQLTPIFDPRWINRHRQRKAYFFDPLVRLLGGSLAGKRVLDLGCNAGFWSLCAARENCEFVLGVDGRQMHIDQANFVLEASGIDKRRYDFRCGNLFELDFREWGSFDVVLCLGLLYHVSKPVTLIEKMAQVNSDVLVIDTTLFPFPGSFLHVRRESRDEPRNAVDYETVLYPTKQAVCDLVSEFGYSAAILRPRFSDYTGAVDYRWRARRAFLCAKQTVLSRSALDIERITPFAQALDACLGSASLVRRGFQSILKGRREQG